MIDPSWAFTRPEVVFEDEINEVGEGWHNIVRMVHERLSYISPDYELFQIKEKFGGLRYYARYVPRDGEPNTEIMGRIFMDIILAAEAMSMSTCETCGSFGRPRTEKYWVKVLCEKCNTADG